jgi:hypothetical protein
MTPSGTLKIDLPRIVLSLVTRFGRRAEEHRAALTTVFLSTETMKLALVWQGTLRVAPRDVDYLDNTRIVEKEQLR